MKNSMEQYLDMCKEVDKRQDKKPAPAFPDHHDCNCALCRARECIEAYREENGQMHAAVGMFKATIKDLVARCGKIVRRRDEANDRILVLEQQVEDLENTIKAWDIRPEGGGNL